MKEHFNCFVSRLRIQMNGSLDRFICTGQACNTSRVPMLSAPQQDRGEREREREGEREITERPAAVWPAVNYFLFFLRRSFFSHRLSFLSPSPLYLSLSLSSLPFVC